MSEWNDSAWKADELEGFMSELPPDDDLGGFMSELGADDLEDFILDNNQ